MPEIGFTCREYMGTEIYKPGDMETRLTKREDVKAGDAVLVPGLGHAWWLMEPLRKRKGYQRKTCWDHILADDFLV